MYFEIIKLGKLDNGKTCRILRLNTFKIHVLTYNSAVDIYNMANSY